MRGSAWRNKGAFGRERREGRPPKARRVTRRRRGAEPCGRQPEQARSLGSMTAINPARKARSRRRKIANRNGNGKAPAGGREGPWSGSKVSAALPGGSRVVRGVAASWMRLRRRPWFGVGRGFWPAGFTFRVAGNVRFASGSYPEPVGFTGAAASREMPPRQAERFCARIRQPLACFRCSAA